MKGYIIVHPVPKNIKEMIKADNAYIVVVDKALDSVIKQEVYFDIVIGDMDSNQMYHHYPHLKLPKEKDITDTQAAFDHLKTLEIDDIAILGGIGGNRIEHFVAHLTKFDHYPKLTMQNDYTKIFSLKDEKRIIKYQGYVSFFGYPEATITLKGFKYPLDQYHLNTYDALCISNELEHQEGEVIVSGRVLVFLSKKED